MDARTCTACGASIRPLEVFPGCICLLAVSNLPPGVSVSMIPGNRPEDDDAFFSALEVKLGDSFPVEAWDAAWFLDLVYAVQELSYAALAGAKEYEEAREHVTTVVGNALVALDDPDGIPGMDEHTPQADRIDYAVVNLCEALRVLEPETYS